MISPKQEKLLQAASEIINNDPYDLGFICRQMVIASMPHSKTKGIEYSRNNNNYTLSITGSTAAGGLPYGAYPRLILSWVVAEIVKTRSREIILGESLSSFMKKLGLQVTGGRWGTITRFKDQLRRLFSSNIHVSFHDKKKGEWKQINMNIADSTQIFWNPEHPDQIDIFKSKVKIGEAFFDEVIRSPVPIDIRVINALKGSSLALDIYFWLTYRLGNMHRAAEISFDQLHQQFGIGYKTTRQGKYEFKRKFLNQLKSVLLFYPEAKIVIKENSLLLKPSPKHIKKTKEKSILFTSSVDN